MAKSVAYVGSGDKDKGDRTCDIAFEHFHSSHVTFLLLIKVCIFSTCLPLGRSSLLGYHRVYGRRTHRCDIAFGRPHCYGPLQLGVLYGPGMCMSCYHATNIVINTSKRHTCIIYLDAHTCSAVTTTVRYIRLSTHDPSLGFYPLHSPWLYLTWSRARSDRKFSYNLKGASGNVALSNACLASMILYALL
ncbi:hypothetical protein EV363DRAFT_1342475 [Boletus edulis]|nr:hypothetical protein EV363DRAFT_1342475 [Boletus edulis]